MSHLDRPGQMLLERLARSHEPGLFADVPQAVGTDSRGALSLAVDAARRVVDARVLDPDLIRGPDMFTLAVRQAFAVADAERALAALEHNGIREEFLDRIAAKFEDRAPVEAPAPPDVSQEASRERRNKAMPDDDEERVRIRPGRADNGYLVLHRAPDGFLVRVEVDAEWLAGAWPKHVERALVEAGAVGMEV